jgi:putative ABC transport system ATP-binding protein
MKAPMATQPVVKTSGLTKVFGTGPTEVRAVNDVSLDVLPGELVLIMGPSGSGKTTLLSMIGGLLRPSAGRVVLGDVDLTALNESRLPEVRARKIGFIFQAFNLLSSLTVEENILFPAGLVPGGTRAARGRAGMLLERLGLTGRRDFLPKDLSGGEKQRVAIARALINEPMVILADEPTGNLDSKRGQEVMMILHDIVRDEGRSVLIVTHDPRVEEIADRILWLEDGALRDRKTAGHSWSRDPVCGMRIGEWTAELASERGGIRYVFCSRRCHERFEAAPDRYAARPARPDEDRRMKTAVRRRSPVAARAISPGVRGGFPSF